MDEKTKEAIQHLADAIEGLKSSKPNDRSEKDRKHAIVITELEKAQAVALQFLRE
jgi:hypothetical protein